MPGDNFAIVAGIDRYPGISKLEGPEQDAKWFHGWLLKNNLVARDNAKLIVSSAFPATAEISDSLPDEMAIDRAFERLLRLGAAKGNVGKRLYLFLAGHGFGPDLNTAALLGSNADVRIGTMGHHINAVDYADWFATAAYFDEIVLFMDCCRDNMPRVPLRNIPWQSVPNTRAGQVKRFYGLATKFAKKSREAVFSDGPGADGQVHGYFTQALMGALEGGAVAKDGSLGSQDVKRYVFNYLTTRVKPTLDLIGGFVEPQFQPEEDFVLAEGLTPKDTSLTVEVPNGTDAKDFMVFGGKPTRRLVNTTGDNPWVLALPMGHYVLIKPDNTAVEFDAFGDEVKIHA